MRCGRRTACSRLRGQRPDGSRDARVIGGMIDYLFAPDDPQAVLDRLANPATQSSP